MITIGLITVNYNNSKDTKKLLESVKKIDKKNLRLIQYVVDCGSKDGSQGEIEKAFPNIISIKSPTNLGFGGGNNLGITRALEDKCDYLLLINNDALIKDKYFLKNLLYTKGDIISPLVKYKLNGLEAFDYGGKVDRLFGRNTHYHSLPSITPDYFSGVCIIKQKVLKKIGGFDANYFLYYEDADFCLRAKKNGFKLGFCPESSIFHNLSATANKFGKRKIKFLADSHLRFCLQHLPVYSMPFYLGFNIYLRLKASV